jgi:hypothetical protein
MRVTTVCALLVMLGATAATDATEDDLNSANHIMPGCKAWLSGARSGFDGGFCVGSVETIGFMVQNADLSITALSGVGRTRFSSVRCASVPHGVTIDQSVQVVIRYIEARPNRTHESFRSLAIEAMLDAWPCRD